MTDVARPPPGPRMALRDPFSSASHLVTAVWAVYATLILLRLTRGGFDRKAAVGVYGLSMVLLYLASATFHGLYYDTPEQRRFFPRLGPSGALPPVARAETPPPGVVSSRRGGGGGLPG